MMGLLDKGNIVWFSQSNDPKRKLKYTLQIISSNNNLVGVNTHLTNKIVLEALVEKKIASLKKFDNIKSEVKKFIEDELLKFCKSKMCIYDSLGSGSAKII